MSKPVHITVGERFGRLTAVYCEGQNNRKRFVWFCQCDCGGTRSVLAYMLRSGRTKRCSICWRHGCQPARIHRIWTGIIGRCTCATNSMFYLYGARGIQVCDEWRKDFVAFRDWALANGYRDGLTVDRKNNDLRYHPDNCRWASPAQQSNNTRRNVVIEIDGLALNISQHAKRLDIHPKSLRFRIDHGWYGDHLIGIKAAVTQTRPQEPRSTIQTEAA